MNDIGPEHPTYVAVETIPEDVIWLLLERTPVGRVAMTRHHRPTLRPVNFVVRDREIFFRTAAHSSLVPWAGSEHVSFEIDGSDDARRLGWSVVIDGKASVVRDRRRRGEVESVLESWAPGTKAAVVRIRPSVVSGRQVVRTSGERLAPPLTG